MVFSIDMNSFELGSDQLQMIAQPCVSVWAVLGLENGDVAAAGSDSLIFQK